MDCITDSNILIETNAHSDDITFRRLSAFKELRKEKGISQAEMAKLIGVNQDKISNYESGKISPRVDVYMKYLDALGYTIQITPKKI